MNWDRTHDGVLMMRNQRNNEETLGWYPKDEKPKGIDD